MVGTGLVDIAVVSKITPFCTLVSKGRARVVTAVATHDRCAKRLYGTARGCTLLPDDRIIGKDAERSDIKRDIPKKWRGRDLCCLLRRF